MGIFKFSDPMHMGSNVIVHQIQNFPYLLYIKLHLKMPGNEQLQISSPPNKVIDKYCVNRGHQKSFENSVLGLTFSYCFTRVVENVFLSEKLEGVRSQEV